jgi:peroxiredoxin
LSLSSDTVPLDEALRRTSFDARTKDAAVMTAGGTLIPGDQAPRRLPFLLAARPSGSVHPEQSYCQMDPHERRIVDFRLPSLDGKWVSFRQIDADLILLDFWGSWCRECGKSIAHLRELESQLRGKRLHVIGIACEKGESLVERCATAAGAVKQLGIDYPVLISSMDGACPLQRALQIQFYPTLVLLDRQGRILHVEQGATDATLARIDRSIESAIRARDGRTYE